MSRWAQYDEDEHRLPEGMRRVGYDADTQVYSYQDTDGSYWEGAPGARYGTLRPVGTRSIVESPPASPTIDSGSQTQPTRRWTDRFSKYTPLEHADDDTPQYHKENPWRLLAPFLLLVGLALLLLFRLLNVGAASGTHPAEDIACGDHQSVYQIRPGDTCWAIAQENDMSVTQLKSINAGIDCDLLQARSKICVNARIKYE